MKSVTYLLGSILLIFISGCSKDNPSTTPKQPTQIQLTEKASEVIQLNNAFGVDLFKAVALDEPDENLMLSPLSASVALTMLLNGCDEETYTQIRDMLGYEGLTTDQINEAYSSLVAQLLTADEEVNLALANAIWYREGFEVKDNFMQTMDEDFKATIEGLDFAAPSALQTINQWASDNTNGKIPQVLNEISPNAVMFLMNALYFKGMWTNQFSMENTYDEIFYEDEETTVSVPFMHGKIQSKAFEADNYKALELSYGRGNFSMIIIVPENNLDEFMNDFEPSTWNEITGTFNDQYTYEVQVTMPKFSFEYEKRLNEQLQALGMLDVFIPEIANLSGITDQSVYVSFVKQNTFIDVNEEGTEAAAVTTIGVDLTSLPDEPQEFVADKPFIFAIREQTTNTLMFIGKLTSP